MLFYLDSKRHCQWPNNNWSSKSVTQIWLYWNECLRCSEKNLKSFSECLCTATAQYLNNFPFDSFDKDYFHWAELLLPSSQTWTLVYEIKHDSCPSGKLRASSSCVVESIRWQILNNAKVVEMDRAGVPPFNLSENIHLYKRWASIMYNHEYMICQTLWVI